MEKAEQLVISENTYIIYTSDNGFHIGQHRLPAGKSCAIEEDINVPFFIRGPGVTKNSTVSYPTSHTDIAPTLLHLADIPYGNYKFDGTRMPVVPDHMYLTRQEHVNVEFWGSNIGEGKFASSLMNPPNNNTYKALRLISADDSFNLLYVVWCTNERELYDLNVDPGQTVNLATDFTSAAYGETLFTTGRIGTSAEINGYPAVNVQNRLDALLMVLKTCKEGTCVQPWGFLHPKDDVKSLKEAMDAKYGCYYRSTIKIKFDGCAKGYLRDQEGPEADREGDIAPYVQPYAKINNCVD